MFEPSIIVAGGVSYFGLSCLILLKGTMKEFSYSQALEYYKESFEKFQKQNKNIFFEQDGASCHSSKKKEAAKKSFWRQSYSKCSSFPR